MSQESMDEERQRRRRELVEERTAEIVRRAEETGELRHLYGKPLRLDEEDEDWMANHVLRNAGFTHPVLERREALDRMQAEAEALLERLVERRAFYEERQPVPAEWVAGFNLSRREVLSEYRDRLIELNRRIRDYNLVAPETMHRRHVSVDNAVTVAEERVPELVVSAQETIRRSWFRRFFTGQR